MKAKRNAIFKGNAAVLCRQMLGDKVITNWDAFLTDCERERAEVAGVRLLPCARMRLKGRRPVYALDDVMAFARLAADSSSDFGVMPIVPFPVEVDDSLPYLYNIVDRFGRLINPKKL
jgi:hypothetical protein